MDLSTLVNVPTQTIVFALLTTFLGVVAHYLKKIGRDNYHWKEYWTTNWQSSLVSIGGALFATMVMLQSGETSLLQFFFIGFANDSILNKAMKKAKNVNPFGK